MSNNILPVVGRPLNGLSKKKIVEDQTEKVKHCHLQTTPVYNNLLVVQMPFINLYIAVSLKLHS